MFHCPMVMCWAPASPELLLRKEEGLHFQFAAAGSARRQPDDVLTGKRVTSYWRRAKDRHEHELVTQAMKACLARAAIIYRYQSRRS